MTEREELAAIIEEAHENEVPVVDAILAAGYVRPDHVEYGIDHPLSDLQFTDDDGELWTDKDDFRWYADDYGRAKQVQRHVTEWVPVTDEEGS